jgi:hypothetical protein
MGLAMRTGNLLLRAIRSAFPARSIRLPIGITVAIPRSGRILLLADSDKRRALRTGLVRHGRGERSHIRVAVQKLAPCSNPAIFPARRQRAFQQAIRDLQRRNPQGAGEQVNATPTKTWPGLFFGEHRLRAAMKGAPERAGQLKY